MIRLLSLLLFLAGSSAGASVPAHEDFALTNVTIVDVERGETLPQQTILIIDGHITAVGSNARLRVPRGFRRIDGAGRYATPGFWDMGSEVFNARNSSWPGAFELMLANGVVGTRDRGSDGPLAETAALVRKVERGEILAPRLVWSGKTLAVPGVVPVRPNQLPVSNEADARSAVVDLAAAGANYVRVTSGFPFEKWGRTVVDAARRLGMGVSGWIVSGWAEAALAGMSSIDHLVDLYRSTSTNRARYLAFSRDPQVRAEIGGDPERAYNFFATLRSTLDERYYAETLRTLGRLKTSIATNYSGMIHAQRRFPLRIASRATWARGGAKTVALPGPVASAPAQPGVEAALFKNLKDLHDAGVPLMTGSDTGSPGSTFVAPGPSVHDEMLALVAAGIPVRAALAAATVNPARYVSHYVPGVEATAALTAGSPADIVLLDANPLESIANVDKIHAVVFAGRWIGPKERQALLARAAALANGSPWNVPECLVWVESGHSAVSSRAT